MNALRQLSIRGFSTSVSEASSRLIPLYENAKKPPRLTAVTKKRPKKMEAPPLPYQFVGENDTPEKLKTNLMGFLRMREVARRRQELNLPVMYPGSIVQISALDTPTSTRARTFVGVVTAWKNRANASSVTLRNAIDSVAINKQYPVYSPLVKEVKVLKYERRARAKLYYLRDKPVSESYINPKQFA
eukprot:comp22866_c1_seq1/m.36087 comp22866_c1_seq1/g.36087  ORF comp22866_c1_seq1/g.36087 comp22866_c1_seq1/m.36087 type:complete len:187 (-) comp22866_c1_seq1:135-695(-)